MRKIFALLLLYFLSYSCIFGQPGHGSLLIAGGGLVPGNEGAYTELVNLAGGPEKASFAIIPAASGVPVRSYAFIRKTLISYGVKPENIHLIAIAQEDDDSTKEVDESQWAGNGSDPEAAALVRKCTGVWFTGGDQTRITRSLYRQDGTRTPVLEAVWEVFDNGGVIGGTSAGAAIMSGVMIGNGCSMGALQQKIITDNGPENEETDALLITKGLGFFPEGIVDQHFNARARLGRLIVALMHSRDQYRLSFGVDENTALIYTASDRRIRVAGKGGVTIIDASAAEMAFHAGLPEITNLSVSYIGAGDAYLASTGEVIPAPGKKPTRGNEYYNREKPAQGGILSPNSAAFPDIITINLIDNKAADSVSNISFGDNGNGFLLTFTKKPGSLGYYAESEDEEDLYTVSDIRLDIAPVSVTINKIE